MRKNLLVLGALAALVAGATAQAQSSYFNSVVALNPLGYWPLGETTAPSPANIAATNLGSLTAAFDAAFTGDVIVGIPGALSGITAAAFDGATAAAVTPYSAAVSNQPSFTVEAWLQANDVTDTECALSDFSSDSSGNRSGWLLYLNVSNPGQYNFRTYSGSGTGASLSLNLGAAGSIAQGVWNHVVIVVSNSSPITVFGYINGVQVASATVSGTFEPSAGADNGGFTMGERTDGGFHFNGQIAEAAYYTTALNATTIQSHYTAGTATPSSYATLVQLSTPILYFPMNQPANPAAVNYGTAGSSANGCYEPGTVPGAAGPSFGAFANGFGSSDIACQFSPSGTQNATNPGPGVTCALYPNSALLNDTNSVTLSAWVKVPAGPVGWFEGVVGRGDNSYRFAVDTSGSAHFADGGNGDIVSATAVNDGNWHQWVGVYDAVAGTGSLYIDGLLAGSAAYTPPTGDPNKVLYIGGAPDYDGRNFPGSIAHVAVFTNALTASQIEQVFASAAPSPFEQGTASLKPVAYWPLSETNQPVSVKPSAMHNSGSLGSPALDANITGEVLLGATGATSDGDAAAVFLPTPGGNTAFSYVQSPYLDSSNNPIAYAPSFTIEAWLKAWDNGNVRGGECPLDIIDAASPRSGWLIYLGVSNPDQYEFRAYNTNGTAYASHLLIGAVESVKPNQWNHLVVVVSNGVTSTNMYGYLNGALVATGPFSGGYVPSDGNNAEGGAGSTAGLAIGQRSDGGFPFNGAIDEVAYYATALDANTVLAHYQTALNPNPSVSYSNLVMQSNPSLYYRLDQVASPAFPVAVNYGSAGAAANGFYENGTTPGTPGPTYPGFGTASYSCEMGDTNGPVNSSEGGPGVWCAFNDPLVLDATASISMTAWVKVPTALPLWFETVLGRADLSYRFSLDQTAFPHFAANPNSDLVGPTALNDGQWHFWAGVFDGASVAGYLYIDGVPVAHATGLALQDDPIPLLIGGAADYANRNFVGNVAQVAIFTNALTQAQVASMYAGAGTPPSVAMPGTSLTVNQGANTNITAVVSGALPLNMQWYYIDLSNTTNVLTNQISASLPLPDVQESQDGWQYFLAISNQYGFLLSPTLTLHVVQGPPTIQMDLSPLLAYGPPGVPDNYSVVASGSLPFYYHWFLNGSTNAIPGATNATYAFSVLPGSNTYQVVVSNAFGPTPSSVATVIALTNAPPIIGFGAEISDWTTNGNGNFTTNGFLELTDGSGGEVSSAFFNTPQYVGGFIANFTFQDVGGAANSGGADGMTFCIENDPRTVTALGGGGGDLGVSSLTPATDIQPCATFEINVYNGHTQGIGFGTNGQTGGGDSGAIAYTSVPMVASGDPINIRLYLIEGVMSVLMTDTATGVTFTTNHSFGDPTMLSVVGAPSAYIGFTGADGGVASTQEILSVAFSSTTTPVLSVVPSGHSAMILWPVTVSTLFELQQAPTVLGPWTAVTATPTVANGQNQVIVNAAGTAQFYRLFLQ